MGEGPLSEEVTEVTIDDANGSNAGLVEARISEDGCSHSETVVLEVILFIPMLIFLLPGKLLRRCFAD